jgi:hypothetical protein
VSEYPIFVEFYSSVAIDIGANVWAMRNHFAQSSHPGALREYGTCAFGKRVKQAFDGLEQRKIGVTYVIADKMDPAFAIAGDDALKPTQVLFDSVFAKMLCSA